MIRINLLEQRRPEKGEKKAAMPVDRLTVGGIVLVVLLTAIFVGWKWYSLSHRLDQLKREIAQAEQERKELTKALEAVDEYQAKKEALQQRVQLISDLKRKQKVPVHLLDQVSRQLPDYLWLEHLTEKDGHVQIQGKATTYNAVSNFYNNLKNSPWFSDVVLGNTRRVPEGVSFQLSCRFRPVAEGGGPAEDDQAAAAAAPRG